MTVKKRALGRGLNDLGLNELLTELNEKSAQGAKDTELRQLPIDTLQPGQYQPRKDMDYEALEDLANSIRAQGVIQPIIVRPIDEGRYEIIAGERRWRASQLAELSTIPAVIRHINDEAAVAMSLIENIQRENLNVIEEANALQRLINEFGMTHQDVAEAVGRSRATVTNILRLLGVCAEVKTMLERGDLEMGHARALLALENVVQKEAAKTVTDKGLSVRATEQLVQRLLQPSRADAPAKATDPAITQLQKQLSERLGTAVKINHRAAGKGKVIISYHSLEALEGLLARVH